MEPREIEQWLLAMGYPLETGELNEISSWLLSTSTMRRYMKSVVSLVKPREEARKIKHFNLAQALEQLSPKEPIEAPCSSVKDLEDYIALEECEQDNSLLVRHQTEQKNYIKLENKKLENLNERYSKLRAEQEKLWKLIGWEEKMKEILSKIKNEFQSMNPEIAIQAIMEEHELTPENRTKAKEWKDVFQQDNKYKKLVEDCLAVMEDEEKLHETMAIFFSEQVPATFVYSELVEKLKVLINKLMDMFYVDPGSSIEFVAERTCSLCIETKRNNVILKKTIEELKPNLSSTIEKLKERMKVLNIPDEDIEGMVPLLVESKLGEEKRRYFENIKESLEDVEAFEKMSKEHKVDVEKLDKKIVTLVDSIKSLLPGNTDELKKTIESVRADFSIPSSLQYENSEKLVTSLRQEEAAYNDLLNSEYSKVVDIIQLLANLEALVNLKIKREEVEVIKRQINEANSLADVEVLDFGQLCECEADPDLLRDFVKVKKLLLAIKTSMDTCHNTLEYWDNNPFNSSLASVNVNGKTFEDLYTMLETLRKELDAANK